MALHRCPERGKGVAVGYASKAFVRDEAGVTHTFLVEANITFCSKEVPEEWDLLIGSIDSQPSCTTCLEFSAVTVG